jgi:hypothetical protein
MEDRGPKGLHSVSRVLLVVVGVALVIAGAAWIALSVKNVAEFHNAGGALGAGVFGAIPGLSAIGTGLFLMRLAAARYPGSI